MRQGALRDALATLHAVTPDGGAELGRWPRSAAAIARSSSRALPYTGADPEGAYAMSRAVALLLGVGILKTPASGIEFELSIDDYRALTKHVCRTGLSSTRVIWLGMVFAVSFCSTVALGSGSRPFLAGMFGGFLLMTIRALFIQHRLRPQPKGAVLCRYDVQLGEDGLHVRTANWASEVPWRGISAVEETADHCFLRTDTVSAHAIPKRAFPNGEATRHFVDFARDRVSRAQAASKTSP